MNRSHLCLIVLGIFALGLLPSRADAQAIASQFNHRSWTNRDGAPIDAWAIAQTTDGWLWIGAPTGLYRFDGVQFEHVAIEGLDPRRAQAVSALYASDSGALWIGYAYDGASVLRNGRFTHFGEAEGLGRGTVLALIEDSQGVAWIACAGGLYRYTAGKWTAVGDDWGFPDKYARAIDLDRNGVLWIAGQHEIFSLPANSHRLQPASMKLETSDEGEFIESPDGRLWFADGRGVHSLPGQRSTTPRPARVNGRLSRMRLVDASNSFWWLGDARASRLAFDPSRDDFLLRDHPSADVFSEVDGLSDVITKTMLEDLEGNLWITTGGGIDRLRRTNLRALPTEVAAFGHQRLAPADDGALWMGADIGGFSTSASDGLWKFDGRLKRIPSVEAVGGITAVALDAQKNLWAGGPAGIWRQDGLDKFRKFADLPEGSQGQDVYTMAVDPEGNPWIGVTRSTLFRYHQGTWERKAGFAELPDVRPTVIQRDAQGRMWIGYTGDGKIAVVESNHARLFGPDEGLDVGRIFALNAGTHFVAAGANRVVVLEGGRFHELTTPTDPSVLQVVAGILEASNGDLWFMSQKGAVRVSAQDFADALKSRRYELPFERFDAEDGFPGSAPTSANGNTLIEGTDGRLWFAGSRNVAWLDPKNIRRNMVAPPISIRSVTSGDRTFGTDGVITLVAGTPNLQIDYTALGLSRPDRIHFRYRLEGLDEHWVDAGARRQAFYTNLGPGSYRFRLTAANENGIWNESSTALDVVVPPTFVQTRWFLVICVAAVLALLWLVYSLRVRYLTRNLRQRLEERLGERERIARELHDTLLQGVQGLLLKFQTVTDEIPNDSVARKMMEDALDRADDVLIEGRDRVKALRVQPTTEPDLPQAIETIGEEQARNQPTRFNLSVEGTPRALDPIVREEVLRIAREALTNAFRHARAEKVEAEIIYDRSELKLRVRDDGCGIDGSILKTGRPDHWGLPGMRERARKIRAKLEVWSRPGTGTEVALSIPARFAFVRQASRWAWWSGKLRPEH